MLAIAAYLPQHQTKIEIQIYQDTLHWLHTLLTIDHPNTPVLIGGDLQATHSPHYDSFYKPLEDFLTATLLTHVGDPHTPTYIPTNSPLDQWLMRIPIEAPQLPPTTTTTLRTKYNDHKALQAEIPQIGDPISHPPR